MRTSFSGVGAQQLEVDRVVEHGPRGLEVLVADPPGPRLRLVLADVDGAPVPELGHELLDVVLIVAHRGRDQLALVGVQAHPVVLDELADRHPLAVLGDAQRVQPEPLGFLQARHEGSH